MNHQEIIVYLKDLYREPKSTKFVLHLIRSYYPFDLDPIDQFPDTNNESVKCSITKEKLHNLSTCPDLSSDYKLAYKNGDTNTYLSKVALESLEMFAEEMSLKNDKRIKFLMNELSNN